MSSSEIGRILLVDHSRGALLFQETILRRRDMVITRGNWLTLVLSWPERKKRPRGRDPGRFWSGTQGAGWEDA